MEKDVEEAESIPLRNISKHSESSARPSTLRQLFDQVSCVVIKQRLSFMTKEWEQ